MCARAKQQHYWKTNNGFWLITGPSINQMYLLRFGAQNVSRWLLFPNSLIFFLVSAGNFGSNDSFFRGPVPQALFDITNTCCLFDKCVVDVSDFFVEWLHVSCNLNEYFDTLVVGERIFFLKIFDLFESIGYVIGNTRLRTEHSVHQRFHEFRMLKISNGNYIGWIILFFSFICWWNLNEIKWNLKITKKIQKKTNKTSTFAGGATWTSFDAAADAFSSWMASSSFFSFVC